MDPTHDLTTEEASPGGAADKLGREQAVALYGPRPAVTRLNRRMVTVAGVLAAGLGLVAMAFGLGVRRPAARDGGADQSVIRPAQSVIDSGVRDLPQDYSFDVRKEAERIGYEAPATKPSADQLAAAEERRRLRRPRSARPKAYPPGRPRRHVANFRRGLRGKVASCSRPGCAETRSGTRRRS